MSALACSSMHVSTQYTQLRSPSPNFYTTTQLRLRAGECSMPGLVVLKMSIAMLTESDKGVVAGRDGKSEFHMPVHLQDKIWNCSCQPQSPNINWSRFCNR